MTLSDLFVHGNWFMRSHGHLPPADEHDALFGCRHRRLEASWNENDDAEVVDPWSETCQSCVIVLAELSYDWVQSSGEISNCCNYQGKWHFNRWWVEILSYAWHENIARFTWSFHCQHNHMRFKMMYISLNVQSRVIPKREEKQTNKRILSVQFELAPLTDLILKVWHIMGLLSEKLTFLWEGEGYSGQCLLSLYFGCGYEFVLFPCQCHQQRRVWFARLNSN